ncbi:ankyrin repeat and SOCS box protein 8-like [Biomphalaria glabrata]|uniref:Ankyrin repeat and SOCS box protein 8-like n=1 Tax=Biomphalaria glabrata TaxID=6526 RepID=A0A9U8E2X8_BIOGL|nr:ankyrin repeat and SOCS box protein 8-like [Biomphalaria glabrata]XP_013070617.2 ankyrin repeat and SOCS box protein 8-like [Biomphalaria glabrata]KAI8744969.1 ankyrin repeat and SOCS box protein 8-like [Biomphalaria glabrata]
MWFVMEQTQEKYRLSDRLIRAISNRQLSEKEDDIEVIIESGADVNRRHGTLLPLHCACMSVESDAVKLLLCKGARINEVDGYGRTALHYAAERDETVVNILLENGADINKGDGNQDTALHWAAYKNNVACVKVLLQNGADVNAVDYNHDTPIIWAAKKGNLDVIKVLLDFNADVDIRNKSGHTALQRSAGIQAAGLNNEQDDATLKLLIKASGRFDLLNHEGQPIAIIASDNRLSEILRPLCQAARPLLELCRWQIRKSMGQTYLPNVIPLLPVPLRLHEFLLLRDEKDILCSLGDFIS